MNKQWNLIENEIMDTEVVVKKKALPRYLKLLALGVGVFIVLTLLFALGGSLINPVVKSTMQKLGIGDQIVAVETSPTAYAWANPHRSDTDGTVGGPYVNSLSSSNMKVTSNKNVLHPLDTYTGWNYGVWISGSGYTLANSGEITTKANKAVFDAQVLYYVDIYIDDAAQHAIKNRQITKCSVSIWVEGVGTGNVSDNGTVNGTFFLCSSATGNANAGLDDMGNTFINYVADKFDDDCQKSRNNYSFEGKSIPLSGDERKIRYGLYYRVDKDAGTWNCDFYVPTPYDSSTFIATNDNGGYTNSKLIIQVNTDGNLGSSEGGNINSLNTGAYNGKNPVNSWNGTNAYKTGKYLFDGIVIDNIQAEANPGYYFAGWTTSGTISANIDKTSRTLTLRGGSFMKGTVTVTAVFRKISIVYIENEGTSNEITKDYNVNDGITFYYTQKWSSGSPVLVTSTQVAAYGQGPMVVCPEGHSGDTITSFVITGGEYDTNGKHTFNSSQNMYPLVAEDAPRGKASKTDRPTEAGDYRMMVGVFKSTAAATNADLCLGYAIVETFTINQIGVTETCAQGYNNVTGNLLNNIPSRPYSIYAYKPSPSYIDISVSEGSGLYRLFQTSDYTITKYEGNVNVTKNAYLFYQTTNKNFMNQGTVKFEITKLNINDSQYGFYYDPTMAYEINQNYGTLDIGKDKNGKDDVVGRAGLTYNGYEQRPDVVLIRLIGKFYTEGSSTTELTSSYYTITIYSNSYGSSKYAYYSTFDESGKETGDYQALASGALGTSVSTFNINVTDNDLTTKYRNNINVCEYYNYKNGTTNTNSACFDITLDKGNLEGVMTCYFDIKQLNLDDERYAGQVEVYDVYATDDAFNKPDGIADGEVGTYYNSYVYYGGQEIKPIPEFVLVKVSGLNPWYKSQTQSGVYQYLQGSTAQPFDVTFVILRDGGTLIATDGDQDVLIDKIRNQTGISIAGGDVQPGSQFDYCNNLFASSGAGSSVNPYVYTNIDYTYTNNNQATRVLGAKASITINLAAAITASGEQVTANIAGSVTTHFTIEPRSLSSIRPESENDDAANKNLPVGIFEYDKNGTTLDVNYTGSKLEPTPRILVYSTSGRNDTYLQDTDFDYSYSNNVEIGKEAVVKAIGKGNYDGEIEAYFYIVARNLDDFNITIEPLEDAYFTGSAINYAPLVITFTSGGITYEEVLTYAGYNANNPNKYDIDIVSEDYSGARNLNVNAYDAFYELDAYGNRKKDGNYDKVIAENYVTIQFLGNDPAGSKKATASEGTNGRFYSSRTYKVPFNIIRKNISSVDAEASWLSYKGNNDSEEGECVTYNGQPRVGLTIIANQDSGNTVTLTDSGKTLKYAAKVEDYDTADYALKTDANGNSAIAWGINTNATTVDENGNTTNYGTVTFVGLNNYEGEITVRFVIKPRNLSDDDIKTTVVITLQDAKTSFAFTGSMIMPGVKSVIDNSLNQTEMVKDEDFTLAYGNQYNDSLTGKDAENKPTARENVFVQNGGTVYVVGKGNYTGYVSTTFEITPISQSVWMENPSTTGDNTNLQIEAIANQSGQILYADYQIDASAQNGYGKVTLIGYTDAILYEPRIVTFTLKNVNGGNSSIASVTYNKLELVTLDDGRKVAKTTATLIYSGFGIVRIFPEQKDGDLLNGGDKALNGEGYNNLKLTYQDNQTYYNYGNYISNVYSDEAYANQANKSSEDKIYSIYGKKQDATYDNFVLNYEATYGNDALSITPGLDSCTQATPYIMEVTEGLNVVTVKSGDSYNSRKIYFENAGTATVKLYHNGFVTSESSAYMPFERTLTFTVKPRKLTISFLPLEVEYGVNPQTATEPDKKFTLSFTTEGGDNYKGLVYGVGSNDSLKQDKETDIIKNVFATGDDRGVYIRYNTTNHRAVTLVTPYNIPVEPGNITEETKGVSYDNYTIVYLPSTLKVVKKTLEAFVMTDGEKNQISKVYGDANPQNLTVQYEGFAYSEDADDINLPPTIDYTGLDRYAPVYKNGERQYYKVSLKGGEANNYIIKEAEVTVIILQANVRIQLNVPEEGFYYDGSRKFLTEEHVKILPVLGASAAAPLPGKITFAYDTNKSSNAPLVAGSFMVWVSFIAAENDNYCDTIDVSFNNGLIINRVPPVINFADMQAEWTGNPLPLNDFIGNVTIRNIATSNREPLVKTPSKIKFAPVEWFMNDDGTITETHLEDWQFIEITSSVAPTEIGIYDIIVEYVANESDVYCSHTERFNSHAGDDGKKYCEITKGLATITIRNASHVVTYTGARHTLNIEDDFNDIIFTPKGSSEVVKLNKANAIIEYESGVDEEGNTTYSSVAPLNTGSYNVRVTYNPSEGEEVAKTVKIFVNAITIEEYDLSKNNGIGLNITGFRTFTYDALPHALTESDVYLRGTDVDVSNMITPKGTIFIQFTHIETGNTTTEPTQAGSYKASIHYEPLETGDNYIASSDYETGKVIQITPANVSIESDGKYTYSFTGAGRPIQGITFYGVPKDGGYDTPLGHLQYGYKASGTSELYSSKLPINAGSYDVEVTYVPGENDNYASYTKRFPSVIIIQKVDPTIIINSVTFAFGDEIVPDYVIRGASADLNGPMQQEGARVSIQYGTAYTTANGELGYDWSDTPPTASGVYSIKVSYIAPTQNSNYNDNTVQGRDKIRIENMMPEIELDTLTVVYDGNAHSALNARIKDRYGNYYTKFTGSDEGEQYYYGIIGYQYRPSGVSSSDSWTYKAPTEVGRYDVRVNYTANQNGDVFESIGQTFTSNIVIEQLVITVMPIYGQGHVYDGTSTDGSEIAYVYSYVKDGYKYMVYSKVGNLERNEILDLSKAEYLDESGNVYSIITDASVETKAWRDYYEKALTITKESFVDGDETITVDRSIFSVSTGPAEFNAPNGKTYVIDLDKSFVYLNSGYEYTIDVERGYYFSILSGDGSVRVISINTDKVVYTSETKGTYEVTTAGIPVTYSLDFYNLTATSGGNVYDIYTTVGLITYTDGIFNYQERIDYASAFLVGEDGTMIYSVTGGNIYAINLKENSVSLGTALMIEETEFAYYDYNEELTTINVELDKLVGKYSSNNYIGTLTVREGLDVIINLSNRTVRIPTFYELAIKNTAGGTTYNFTNAYGENFILMMNDFVRTDTPNVYLYEYYGESFYIDVNSMQVRSSLNLFTFNGEKSTISQIVNGVEQSIAVDTYAFRYDIYRNGKLYNTTGLFGEDYGYADGDLIGTNSWSGNLALMAQNAGSYNVALGNLQAGRNYQVSFLDGVTYTVERAELTIEFTGDKYSVYDGENKAITYSIEGLKGYDRVIVTQTYDGDNLNVTANGFRAIVTVQSENYVLVGGISEYYYIQPAVMAKIEVADMINYVYDGNKHVLELTGVERGATVTYAGGEIAPYFVMPGTYSVVAIVSKPNYVSQEVELKMTIAKAKYTVNALEVPGTLTFGDALPDLRCDSDLGEIKLDNNQILLPSQTEYTWTFVPHSKDFFKYYEGNAQGGNAIIGKINLKVERAQAKIEVQGDLVQSLTNPETLRGVILGSSSQVSEVTIVYVGSDGIRYNQMPSVEGKYTVLVTYAGDDNYAPTTYETILTIEKESNFEWLYSLGAVLLILSVFSTVFFLVRRNKKID